MIEQGKSYKILHRKLNIEQGKSYFVGFALLNLEFLV
jgi:hypothetical protein